MVYYWTDTESSLSASQCTVETINLDTPSCHSCAASTAVTKNVLIPINPIQNKSFHLQTMCVYYEYLLCIYKYIHMHVYIVKIFTYIYFYSCNLFYIMYTHTRKCAYLYIYKQYIYTVHTHIL